MSRGGEINIMAVGDNIGWGWGRPRKKDENEWEYEQEAREKAEAAAKKKGNLLIAYPVHVSASAMYYANLKMSAGDFRHFLAEHPRAEVVGVMKDEKRGEK